MSLPSSFIPPLQEAARRIVRSGSQRHGDSPTDTPPHDVTTTGDVGATDATCQTLGAVTPTAPPSLESQAVDVGGPQGPGATSDDEEDQPCDDVVIVPVTERMNTLKELRTMCAHRGISDKGKKAELASRIQDHDAQRSSLQNN